MNCPCSIHSQGKGSSAQLRPLSRDQRSVLRPFHSNKAYCQQLLFPMRSPVRKGWRQPWQTDSQTHPGQSMRKRVRLSWRARHIPVGTPLLGGLLLAAFFSAVVMIISQGPHNPIP